MGRSGDTKNVRRRSRHVLLTLVCALALVPAANAELLLGVSGDASRMRAQTGQRSDGTLRFFRWNQGLRFGGTMDNWWQGMGRVPIVGLTVSYDRDREIITPLGIARGRGDRWLMALSRAIHRRGGEMIVRPLAEMNGHWNPYSAYNANGTRRNSAHSQKNFKRAFKRIYLILHGGDRATINAKLARSKLPGIRTDLPENPAPQLRILWNPQGYGSPNVPGNRAHMYYPGNAYVDMVGNDLYEANYRATWEANLALFRRYPSKPYALGEFGLWGVDHPDFIRRMGQFIRTHRRVQLAVYYKAERGSVFDLGSKPRSRAAYRRYITPLGR